MEDTTKKARSRDEAYHVEAFGYGGDDELFWSEMKRDNMYMSASRLKKGDVNEVLKKIDGAYLVKTPKSSRTYMVIPKVSDTNYTFDNFFHGYESGVLVYKKELTGAVSDGEPGALWSRTEYYTYLNGLKVGIYTEEESGDDYRSKENGKENNNSKFVGGGAETHNYYCSYDGQGNISQVSNMAGDMPYNMYAYDSYGTQTGDDYYNEDFSGYKGYDKGPLGYKTGVRHYDPETGRFLSPDPFKGYMTDPASQHPYMYCHGNPVRFSDPSGYWSFEKERRKNRDALHLIAGGITDIVIGIVLSQADSPLPGPGDAAGLVFVGKGAVAISGAMKLLGVAKISLGSAKMMSRSSKGRGNNNYHSGSNDSYYFEGHSVGRVKRAGLIPEDVIEALENAKSTFRGNKPNSRYIIFKKKFKIVFNPKTKKIISVVKLK